VVISFVFVLVCHQQILRNITQFTLLLWRLKWTNHAPHLFWFWSHCHCDSWSCRPPPRNTRSRTHTSSCLPALYFTFGGLHIFFTFGSSKQSMDCL
jgi:hypothetical protein